MTRSAPFPPPVDPEQPDSAWAAEVVNQWAREGFPDLDGPPADQMRVAEAVLRGDRRVGKQTSDEVKP